jgi:hypothetical protein
MKQSDRISRDHEECLARLRPEQRATVIDETTRLLKRLRLTTTVHVSDVDIVERLRSALNGSRKTNVEGKKG